ncbi:MAG: trigger factor [Prevotellamassilia sp.]|nr:trigger factor [Prevotellamassilia sp.]
MDIQFEKIGKVSGEITINMVKADYEANVNKALKDLGKKVQMPGFRPGHVPASLVKKMYGVQAKADEVNKLLQDSLFDFIKTKKINMLGEPLGSDKQTPQDIEKQDDFTFIFNIAIAPKFKAELGEDDTIDYYDIEVSDDTITKQLGAMQQQAGHPESVDAYEDRDILRGTLAELDENGQPKENGIVVETASLMPSYFQNDDQKKIFEGAKKNDVITFNPTTAYNENEAELSSLFKIERDDVKEHTGDFSFQVNEISRFVPASLDQEFFDKVFGKDEVKSEDEARTKIKESINELQKNDSDYKFLLDVRAYAENKVGTLEFPDELLKKIMKANNKDKDDKFIEDNYAKSIEELKWSLIKDQLAKANKIKVNDKDVKEAAIQAARFQFAQYGMNNIPDEYLENYAQEMLKHQEQVNSLIERCVDQKLSEALKSVVKLNHKSISQEDFAKMFEENK